MAPVSPAAAELQALAELDRAEVARLFFVDGSGRLALRRLPATGRETRADTLMLVLYGMLTLRGESPLTERSAIRLFPWIKPNGIFLLD